jgi:hypothetical protein
MTDPIEQIRQKLVDHIAQIIDQHHATGVDAGSDVASNCGTQGISQHSRQVASQIVDQLGVKPEIDEVKQRIRYASAIFDWELTQIEGAQF